MGIARDCPIFLATSIISRTGKTTDFKFCTHIHMIDQNNSPWKIFGNVSVGVVRESRKCSWHLYTRRIARGHLCDSTAFLLASWAWKIVWQLMMVATLAVRVYRNTHGDRRRALHTSTGGRRSRTCRGFLRELTTDSGPKLPGFAYHWRSAGASEV